MFFKLEKETNEIIFSLIFGKMESRERKIFSIYRAGKIFSRIF